MDSDLRLVDEAAPVPEKQSLARLWNLGPGRLPRDEQVVLESDVRLEAAEALANRSPASLVQRHPAEPDDLEEPVQTALRIDEEVLRVEVDPPVELVRRRSVEN